MQVLCSTTQAQTIYPDPSVFWGNNQISFLAQGLEVGEDVLIEFSIDGSTWTQLYQYGYAVKLNSANNVLGIYAPCRLRIIKPTTVNPVTIAMGTTNTTNT
jgi:hypothetical protein